MSFQASFRELVSGRWKGVCPAALRGVLAAAEPIYAAVVRRKNRRFDRGLAQPHRVAPPVISIGNLTVGGTGKTPFVCWLAEWFLARGTAVTLISRGYGARQGQPNDEALELSARLPSVPHLQNPDRIAATEEALQSESRQVLILDDAFQHRRIARDLDIVLLDALEPFGYGRLLPRGLLREPVASLARAQVVALSRSDAVDQPARDAIRKRVEEVAPQAVWLELAHLPVGLVGWREMSERHRGRSLQNDGPERHGGRSLQKAGPDLESLRGKKIAAFCGIGNPAGFRHTLASCGLEIAGFRELPDHFAYPLEEITKLSAWVASLGPIEAVVCTRKDLVKIPRETLGEVPLWALDIDLQIVAGQDRLEALLLPVARRVIEGQA